MARILILYSSTDGHTIEICARLQQVIERHAHDVTVAPIAGYRLPDPDAIDKIVIGASIRYGRHSKQVSEFIDGNRQLLDSKPNAFFSVNIVARKPEKNRPETNPYLRKFLTRTSWHPQHLEVFAGKLDYPKYGPLDRMMIRFIMLITKGPTDPATVVDFTDWQRVDAFGELVSRM
jgi:menaquinone-dependent protoporphyrinogen oxidase